jgi:hypothetical protein
MWLFCVGLSLAVTTWIVAEGSRQARLRRENDARARRRAGGEGPR